MTGRKDRTGGSASNNSYENSSSDAEESENNDERNWSRKSSSGFNLIGSDICSCGQVAETGEHVLLYCKLYFCKRENFEKELKCLGISWPPVLSLLVNCTESLNVLRKFVGKILGESTPLATNRKKRQVRTRWCQAKQTMAAKEYSIRRMRNENICKQYRN
ncbi:UNVERIFIED_CONTAM: hypothetical protein NCL1_43159 [Trichonephila clavipes]